MDFLFLVLSGSENVGKTTLLKKLVNILKVSNYSENPKTSVVDFKNMGGAINNLHLKFTTSGTLISCKDCFYSLRLKDKIVVITTMGDTGQCIKDCISYFRFVLQHVQNNNSINKVVWVTALSCNDKNYSNNGIGTPKRGFKKLIDSFALQLQSTLKYINLLGLKNSSQYANRVDTIQIQKVEANILSQINNF